MNMTLQQAAEADLEKQRRDREAQAPAAPGLLLGEARELAANEKARRLASEARMQVLETSKNAALSSLREQHAREMHELDGVAVARVKSSEAAMVAALAGEKSANTKCDEMRAHRDAAVEQAAVEQRRSAWLETELTARTAELAAARSERDALLARGVVKKGSGSS
jgi:hypothetical protein